MSANQAANLTQFDAAVRGGIAGFNFGKAPRVSLAGVELVVLSYDPVAQLLVAALPSAVAAGTYRLTVMGTYIFSPGFLAFSFDVVNRAGGARWLGTDRHDGDGDSARRR